MHVLATCLTITLTLVQGSPLRGSSHSCESFKTKDACKIVQECVWCRSKATPAACLPVESNNVFMSTSLPVEELIDMKTFNSLPEDELFCEFPSLDSAARLLLDASRVEPRLPTQAQPKLPKLLGNGGGAVDEALQEASKQKQEQKSTDLAIRIENPAVRPSNEETFGSWTTSIPDIGDTDLIKEIKQTGFYTRWGIPFENVEAVQSVINSQKILFIGDSYIANVFIELSDLYFNEVPTTSRSNPVFSLGVKKKLHENRYSYQMAAIKRLRLANVPLNYMGQYQFKEDVLASVTTSSKKTNEICNMKPQGSYYIETLTQLTDIMSSDCFRNWLSQFSVIFCNLYIHDVGIAHKFFKMTEYPQKLQTLLNLMPQKIKEKLIWLTPKSYRSTDTPEIYRLAQEPSVKMLNAVSTVLQENQIQFIDFFNSTNECQWTNCTVEDHHHSRMVSRAVAMRFIDLIKNK
jgi:hypothetical protein